MRRRGLRRQASTNPSTALGRSSPHPTPHPPSTVTPPFPARAPSPARAPPRHLIARDATPSSETVDQLASFIIIVSTPSPYIDSLCMFVPENRVRKRSSDAARPSRGRRPTLGRLAAAPHDADQRGMGDFPRAQVVVKANLVVRERYDTTSAKIGELGIVARLSPFTGESGPRTHSPLCECSADLGTKVTVYDTIMEGALTRARIVVNSGPLSGVEGFVTATFSSGEQALSDPPSGPAAFTSTLPQEALVAARAAFDVFDVDGRCTLAALVARRLHSHRMPILLCLRGSTDEPCTQPPHAHAWPSGCHPCAIFLSSCPPVRVVSAAAHSRPVSYG